MSNSEMPAKIYSANSPDDTKNNESALTLSKAAKLSPFVTETTIGALANNSPHDPRIPVESTPTNGQTKPSNKWKNDVWHRVDLEQEKKSVLGFQINVMDLQAIQVRMSLKKVERARQEQVRVEMAQRQSKLNELEQMMEKMRISNLEKSEKRLERDSRLKEERIQLLIEEIEAKSKIAEEETMREIDEHSRKSAEKISRLKRVEELRAYFQSIKSLKALFIMLFEKFVKTYVSNQQQLKNLQTYTDARESYLMRYESVLKLVNAGQLTSAEVNALETICDDIKESQRSVDDEVQQASEELTRAIADRNEREKLKLEELQQQQQQHEKEQHEQHQQQLQHQQQQQDQRTIRPSVDTTDRPIVNSAMVASNNIDISERRRYYQTIMSFYESYAESVKPLQNDVSMKKFRFECIKCVNILSNSISSVNLQEKYDRFALILSGNSIEIGGTRVTPSQHPLGIRFVNFYVAKMFVKQADTSMAVLNPTGGFPMAALIVALWQKFPEFGKLFLACVYKQSPFVVPLHIHKSADQSDEDYFKSIGFVFTDNVCETESSFLKRLTGVVRLYASVIIIKPRRQTNKPHPHGIEFAWIWLTNVLNLDPIADVSATMIHEFLVIAGSDLYKTYNKQFFKLIATIHHQYMTKLDEHEAGGPKSRLDNFIRKILQEKKIDSVGGSLPANFQ